MNPKIKNNPLSKTERKELLKISDSDVEAAIVKAKRSMNALVQADVQ